MDGKLQRDLTNTLYRLLVDCMYSEDIREFTVKLLNVAPKTFWTEPASRNHHAKDERGECGNLLHTIRVIKTVKIIAMAADCGQFRTDILVSAAALHDICRHGLFGLEEFSVSNHPELIKELAKNNDISCNASDIIFTIIEAHMGIWGRYPRPAKISVVDVLHLADVINARLLEEII